VVVRSPDARTRAWSSFVIKSVDEEHREIQGLATTPSTDRMGDVVMSEGAQFTLPLPFLWQHDSSQPVGHVIAAEPTKAGIPVTVRMVRIDDPGTLRDRLEEAWQSVKSGLVRGLSIGFAPIEFSYMEDTGGYRFSRWSWLELSAMTIPANSDASIAVIKRYDLTPARPPQKSWPFKTMTWGKTTPSQFASQLANHLLESVGDVVVEALSARDAKIKSLQEQLSSRTYKGVYDPANTYRKHNMVTLSGSLWIAMCDTGAKPGESEDWQLAVKKGRDAR
jgi:HK97 family phage prohead protease